MARKTTAAPAAATTTAPAQPENKFSAKERKAIAAIAASATAADTANRQRTSTYGQLATDVELLLGKVGDHSTARLLAACYAALAPDLDDDKEKSAVWKRRAQILSVTVRRFVTGKAGEAPRFDLLYVALDSAACTAKVVCLAKPTPAEVKLALAGDQKALNAHMGRLFPPKGAKVPGKPEPDPMAQPAMPGKVNKGDAMGALRELVAGWRPGELEAAAAYLLETASAGRKALELAKRAS